MLSHVTQVPGLAAGFLEILAYSSELKCRKSEPEFCQDTYLQTAPKVGVGWGSFSFVNSPSFVLYLWGLLGSKTIVEKPLLGF